MGVLLGLGHVELAPTGLREGLGQRACFLRRERDVDRQARLVLGHRHHEQVGRSGSAVGRRAVEAGEVAIGQGVGQLARPVGAEVGMDDRVARADGTVHAVDHGGGHELVVLAAGVGGLDGGDRVGCVLPHPVDDRVVAPLDPVPAAVAVHRPVATADRRDPRVRVRDSQAGLEVGDEAERRARRRVATVEQRVDADRGHTLSRGQLGERDEVPVVGVDAARADEADQVEPPVGPGRARAGLEERRALEERAVGDGGVDARQVLQHGPPGAEVQVAHLRVAHLAGGQPDGVFRGAERGMGPVAPQRAPGRHVRGGDGVRRGIPPDPEPVEDDQDDGARTRRGRLLLRHAAARAAAVSPARATIPAISSGFSDAPPTRAPSIEGSARNSAMFADVTLPP